MTVYRWIASAAALAVLGACAVIPAEHESKTYAFSGFDAINTHSGIDVVLKQGPFSVSAEAPKGKLDKIVIEQSGSTLDIGRKAEMQMFSWGINERYVVTVAAPNFTAITASSGSDVDADTLNVAGLKLNVSGGADLRLNNLASTTLDVSSSSGADLKVKQARLGAVTVTVSGGGDFDVAGSCKSLTLEASSGADFRGKELTCETATISASGGGDASVAVNGGAAVGKASSGADISFYGNPLTVEKEETGGGDVHAPKTAHPAPA